MKKKENVLDKIVHFAEDTTSGLAGEDSDATHDTRRVTHSKRKDALEKHKDVTPIWNTKKRKTHP